MNKLREALEFESKNKVLNAAELYEEILVTDSKPPLEAVINLIMIYFSALDPGDQREYGLSDDFVERSANRLLELFPYAQKLYPSSIELKFWHNLIFSIYKCDPWGPAYDDIDSKFSHQTETLYPYYIFFNPEKNLFVDEASKLWVKVKEGKTCKDRYVKSVLAGYFDRSIKEFPGIDQIIRDKNGNILEVILKKDKT